MHNGKYVFAQLLDFIDKDIFLWISPDYWLGDDGPDVEKYPQWDKKELENQGGKVSFVDFVLDHNKELYDRGRVEQDFTSEPCSKIV